MDWQQLLGKFKFIVENPISSSYKHALISCLIAYTSKEEDYKPYVFYDESGYTKNLVEDFGQDANIVIMCWSPRQTSTFHAHEGSKCWVKVLQGELVEQQVPYPGKTLSSVDTVYSEKTLSENDVTYIDDSIGLHKVTNKSPNLPAITLHFYEPAYKYARIFDAQNVSVDKSKKVEVTFHSKFGLKQNGMI